MVDRVKPAGPRMGMVVLAVVAIVALSGCTRSPPASGGGGEGGEDDGGQGTGFLGPYAGLEPGVDTILLPDAGADGIVNGVVYDVTSGEALAGAVVHVTCVVGLLGAPVAPHVLVTGEEGAFALSETAGLAGCASLGYEVEAAGYHLVVPLDSGPLREGVQYLVQAGMIADLP